MANEIDTVMDALCAKARTITGLSQVPDHPPEAANDPPMGIVYISRVRPSNPAVRTVILEVKLDILL
ncbi:MAG: hypothetical protein EHM39_02415, partial [Chloroflexi bacterium]